MRQLIHNADGRTAVASRDDVMAEARTMLRPGQRQARRTSSKTLADRRREMDSLAIDSEIEIERSDDLLRTDRRRRLATSPAFQRCRLAAAQSPADAARVAFHEAGHALAAHLEGFAVDAVGLHFDTRSGFHGEGGCTVDGRLTAGVLLAGIAAEHVARSHGRISAVSADSCWRDDRARAVTCLPMGSDVTLEMRRTQDRLRPHWRALSAIAGRILRDLEIDGAEVRDIVRSSRAAA